MSDDDARLAALERRLADFERKSVEANARTAKVAEEAKRRSHDSIHEIESIAAGLVSHMARAEALRAAEADEDKKQRAFAEQARKSAAGAHAKRFEEQGQAIHALTEHVRGATSRNEKARWFLGALFATLTILGNQCVEVAKVMRPQPAPVEQLQQPRALLDDGGLAR